MKNEQELVEKLKFHEQQLAGLMERVDLEKQRISRVREQLETFKNQPKPKVDNKSGI